jgi:hypothetical protein
MVIVFILSLAVVLAYVFLGKATVTRAINAKTVEKDKLDAVLLDISKKQAEIPKLRDELPMWNRQRILFRSAIPEKIEDDKFLGALADRLEQTGIELISAELAPSGSLLKDADEKAIQQLKDAGVDVVAAKKIQVAYYSVNLSGDFGKVINAFESLKRDGRLYTIDMISAPAGGGGGAVFKTLDPSKTPIKVTGAIYYGLPGDRLTAEWLVNEFTSALAPSIARRIFSDVLKTGERLVLHPSDKSTGAGGSRPGTQSKSESRSRLAWHMTGGR